MNPDPNADSAPDHDQLFKQLLTTFFVEFVELFLPDVAQYLERDSIEFLDKEVFTDIATGDVHEVDVLVKARFLGQDAFFLVHVENQSTSEADFPARMFRYFARLYAKYNLPVYPVVILSYDRPLTVAPSRHRIEFPGFVVNRFDYRVLQLNQMSWRDYLNKSNPVAVALMSKMNIPPGDRPYVRLECLRLLTTLKLNRAKARLIAVFVDRYLRLTAAETQVYNRELAALRPPERRPILEYMTSWERTGYDKGLLEGRRDGQKEGKLEMLLQLMQRRFGVTDDAVTSRVRALTVSQLDALGLALFDLQSADDVQTWLEQQAA